MLPLIDAAYSWLYGVGNALLIRIEYPAATCAIFLLLELLLPRQRNSWASYWRGARFVVLAVALNTLVLIFLTMASGTEQVAAGSKAETAREPLAFLDLRPLTTSDSLWVRAFGYTVATLGIAAVNDFFYYWMHRAQHRFGWFWRFHRVHHSITELSATNSYHHLFEDLFQFVAITIPISFLLGVESGPVPWLVIVLNNTHSYFLHSSTSIDIGPLRYVFSDNRIHRIHHSVEQGHRDKNFSTVTPLWDVIFGTALFPKGDQWPAVGLEDVAEPTTVAQYLLMPFQGAPPRPGNQASRGAEA
jgi:sterol desaturase/sphingolipid hydroxylase (fatty acid hydroxylase superfamily)